MKVNPKLATNSTETNEGPKNQRSKEKLEELSTSSGDQPKKESSESEESSEGETWSGKPDEFNGHYIQIPENMLSSESQGSGSGDGRRPNGPSNGISQGVSLDGHPSGHWQNQNWPPSNGHPGSQQYLSMNPVNIQAIPDGHPIYPSYLQQQQYPQQQHQQQHPQQHHPQHQYPQQQHPQYYPQQQYPSMPQHHSRPSSGGSVGGLLSTLADFVGKIF